MRGDGCLVVDGWEINLLWSVNKEWFTMREKDDSWWESGNEWWSILLHQNINNSEIWSSVSDMVSYSIW